MTGLLLPPAPALPSVALLYWVRGGGRVLLFRPSVAALPVPITSCCRDPYSVADLRTLEQNILQI